MNNIGTETLTRFTPCGHLYHDCWNVITMLLKDNTSGKLVEIAEMATLFDPYHHKIKGSLQWGEDPADPELFEKICLSFPSGEPLPACWTDEHYRDHEIKRSGK